MVLAIEPGVYWPEGGGLRVEDNFLVTESGAERLCRFPDGIVSADGRPRPDLDRRPQPARARAAVARHRRPLRHDARDGEQTVGVVPRRRKAGDRPRARRGGRRPDRGGLRPRLRGRRGGDPPDRRRRPPRRDLGLRTCRPGGCRATRRTRRPGGRDRKPDLRCEARALGVSHDDSRRIGKAVWFAAGEGITGRVLRRRRLAWRRRPPGKGLRGRGRGGPTGGEKGRHDRGLSRPKARRVSGRRSRLVVSTIPSHWHGDDDFGLADGRRGRRGRAAGGSWGEGTVELERGSGRKRADPSRSASSSEGVYGIPTWLTSARSAKPLGSVR